MTPEAATSMESEEILHNAVETNLRNLHDIPAILKAFEGTPTVPAYTYYCEICRGILAVTRKLVEEERIRFAFRERCPFCHYSLDWGLQCRRLEIPLTSVRVIEAEFAGERTASLSAPTLFSFMRSGSDGLPSAVLRGPSASTPCLTFGDAKFDNLLGGLHPGEFVVLQGSRVCHTLSELLCVRAQLPRERGGLDSKVLFIDGGNIFDPYLIATFSRRFGLPREEALSGIQVSRAFTCYQLNTLITERLPQALERLNPRLVVLSDIINLYRDPDLDWQDVRKDFNHLTNFLAQLAEKQRLVIVATDLVSNLPPKKHLLRIMLTSRSHVVAKIEGGEESKRVTLEKHPGMPLRSVSEITDLKDEFSLEDFLPRSPITQLASNTLLRI